MKRFFTTLSLILSSFGWIAPAFAAKPAPLRICATVPDLGDLARQVGGTHVSVVTFAKGTEDPHFVDARPSFILELSKADLFIVVGMELEVGWAPVLTQGARNGKVLPGAKGYVDASSVIAPLDTPKGIIDRTLGDVHPAGNPHYLLDPVNGIRVARLIRDKLIDLRPEWRADFEKSFEVFRGKIAAGLVGEKLAGKYDIEKLMVLQEHGKLLEFLGNQKETELLNGWLGALRSAAGIKVVVDHNMWPYFAQRFGLVVAGSLEPKPGMQPTTKHLGEIIAFMKGQGIKIVLASSYYDPRHARFVSEATGAKVLAMAHQVGSRPGTETYLEMMAYNVKQVSEALHE